MASTSSNTYDMPQLETPSRRSKLADRTSSLLSQLHPGRWVRSHHEHHHHHHQRKDSSPAVTPPPRYTASQQGTKRTPHRGQHFQKVYGGF